MNKIELTDEELQVLMDAVCDVQDAELDILTLRQRTILPDIERKLKEAWHRE